MKISESVRRGARRLLTLLLVVVALYAAATAANAAWSGQPHLDQATTHVLPSPGPVGP